jgi:hypothetical protein
VWQQGQAEHSVGLTSSWPQWAMRSLAVSMHGLLPFLHSSTMLHCTVTVCPQGCSVGTSSLHSTAPCSKRLHARVDTHVCQEAHACWLPVS